MAKGIYVSFISLLLMFALKAGAQDTINLPLNIRAGFDIAGPVMKTINNDLISYGALGSVDLNEAISLVAGVRYSSFSANEYSYDYRSRGLSIVIGADYNFLKPGIAAGKYYAGIGFRYGVSIYGQEASRIEYTNPWGTGSVTMPLNRHFGNYLELAPGVRTEFFPGVTIGWNLYARLLLGAGTGKDLKPVHLPGFGDASSSIATGVSYYISITIPYKKIRVITKPKPVSEEGPVEGEPETTNNQSGFNGSF